MSDFACEGCGKELHQGDLAHHCADGVALCEACAPTFQDMLDEMPEQAEADYAVTAGVQAWIAEHLSAGGALTDKAVRAIPTVSEADLARIRAAMEDAEDAPAPLETQH